MREGAGVEAADGLIQQLPPAVGPALRDALD